MRKSPTSHNVSIHHPCTDMVRCPYCNVPPGMKCRATYTGREPYSMGGGLYGKPEAQHTHVARLSAWEALT